MESTSSNTIQRRYDIDWLRNFGILLLFPFHAARVFDVWEPFYAKNASTSWTLSWFINIFAYWFMPLLFLLAGSSSWYALEHRTGKQYLKERLSRLLIPFIFGILVIVPPQGYLAKLRLPDYSDNYWQFLKGYFSNFSDLSGYFGTFTPAHLWFILYLFILSIAALPLFLYLKKAQVRESILKGLNFKNKPWLLVFVFVPLTLSEALPSPGGKNPFYYLFIIIVGYYISSDAGFQNTINKYTLKLLVFIAFYTPLWLMLDYIYRDAEDFSLISIFLAFMKNFGLCITLSVILGLGNKYLNFKTKWLSYMSEAAFPVYILHQTILIFISYYVVNLNLSIFPKFVIITLATFILSLLLYEFVIKEIGVLRFLFGVKLKTSKIMPINSNNYKY